MKRLLLALWIVMGVSCTSSLKDGVAYFDAFTYIGEDDFYTLNPLPGPDYYYNPILPGWYSDPSVCSNDKGDYFLVTSTFCYVPGVPIFHSKDLVNWTQIGNVLDRPSQLLNFEGNGISTGIFAPDISYNPDNQTYYMITTNVCDGNFFVKTQDPYGPWSEPIKLPSVNGIDPSFFFDTDGKAYIVHNSSAPNNEPEYDGHCTIRIHEFDVKTDKVIGEERIIVNKGTHPEDNCVWIEGPHLYKIDGRYLLMAAEGGTEENHSEVIFSADNPWGPYIPWSGNPILTQRHLDPGRPNPVTCTGHADLIQTVEGDWWAFFLGCRPLMYRYENLGRETFLMPVKWSEDGFPYITSGTDQVPLIGKKKGVQRSEHPTFGNYEFTDNFTDSLLHPSWMHVRVFTEPELPHLSLETLRNGVDQMGQANYLAYRMKHHKFTCTTSLCFNPNQEGQQAGLLLFKDDSHYYFLSAGIIYGDKCVTLQMKDTKGIRILENRPWDNGDEVFLKVVSHGLEYDFYYATKEDQWQLLSRDVDATFLSTATAGGFTGSTIGPYAVQEIPLYLGK